jgi:16S rRNA (uracil1498-N3)-methyltransferase
MPRFFFPGPLVAGTTVDLPETVAHHLHVVRQQAGADLVLFNGEGGQYRALLSDIGKKRAAATVLAFEPLEVELPYVVTLAQALPEASKMDWIIEKAVELGVAAVQPLAAQRCVVKLSGERAEKRHAHWEGVVAAASEQSGRNRLARVEPLADFRQWLEKPAPGVQRVLLTPRATVALAHWARSVSPQAVAVLVGPEGGFTEQEEDAAIAAGALALSMGSRVLRTETAGLATLAALGALWGDS